MKARILVVDDEADIRDMLSRHFRYLGYEVATAGNGQEAVEALEQARTDIVVSDIVMPVMDGIELLRVLRSEYPMIRTIMITGYVTLDNALACMRLGADTLIFKPLEDLAELEQAVEQALAGVQRWIALLKELQSMKPETAGE